MDWGNALPIGAVVGAVGGWVLSEMSGRFRAQREWRRRLREIKIDAYAEWMVGMANHLVRYAREDAGDQSEDRTVLCETKLLLVEHDGAARRLIAAVRESMPDYGTDDYQELRELAHTAPDWEWPPFQRAMEDLRERVRSSLE